jgi:hypothetical protein
MRKYIQKLLRESLLKEIDFGVHSVDRLIKRFNAFNDEDVSKSIKQEVIYNLELLKNNNLSKKTDYGIYLGGVPQNEINKDSIYYKNYLTNLKRLNYTVGSDKHYYSIGTADEFFGDSTGNEFWLIVRGNKATTFMLRKDVQGYNTNDNKIKLDVDVIIRDLDKWLTNRSDENKPKSNKFKKVKLSDDRVIKYYEGLNKFETFDGQPLDINDIFDDLPEDVQDKVIEVL